MKSNRMMMVVRQLAMPRRRRHTIPKIVRDCILLLIIGHGLTFISVIFYKIWPAWTEEKVDWFLSPFYRLKMEREWYFKMGADYLLNVITYYIMAKVAAKFSDSLFIVCVIFFGYHVVDCFFFFWNFNGQFYIYLDLFYTAIILIKYAVLPYKPEKFAKLRSLF